MLATVNFKTKLVKMDGENTAVSGGAVENTTETGSAPVEQTTGSVSNETTASSEKTPNTSGDKGNEGSQAIPYDRFKEVNDKYKSTLSENEKLREKAELFDKLQQDPDLARSVMKNFGLQQGKEIDPAVQAAINVFKEHGFLTEADFNQRLEAQKQEEAQQRAQERVVESFQRQIQELSEKYNGENGMPKLEAEVVADFMDNNGIIWNEKGEPDVEAVYFLLNRDAVVDAQAKNMRKSTFTEKPGGDTESQDDVRGVIDDARKSGDFSNVFKTFLKK